MKKMAGVVAGAAALLMLSSSAFGLTLGFFNVTGNYPGVDVASQLFVDVNDVVGEPVGEPNQVSFVFHNIGTISSSITDVYFDDGTLLGIHQINWIGNVSFDDPAIPANLPGGNNITPAFTTTAGFSADSDTPIMTKGVNNSVGDGEQLTIRFDLINNKTYADTIAALNDGSLRIGLHVQSIGTAGKSDSFVNKVPEPGTFLILSGCLALGMVYRRKLTD